MKESAVYPSYVSDEEWAFAAPYLTLMTEEAPQREYPLRSVFVTGRFKTSHLWAVQNQPL